MQLRTLGVSPKLVADLLTSVAAFALAHYAISLDATESALLAKAIGAVAAYFAPPAPVVAVHAKVRRDHTDKPDRTPIA